MKTQERITIDPCYCHGKPCICRLRYPVQHVLEWLAAGLTFEDILNDYPELERDDILAALDFAAKVMHAKRVERFGA